MSNQETQQKKAKKNLFCIDRYNGKNAIITANPDIEYKQWNKLVYETSGPQKKQSVALYLGYEDDSNKVERWWDFLDFLSPEDIEYFDKMQKQALEKFKLFRKEFKKSFPDSVLVTARHHIFDEQYYFYFYAEERYNFVEFIKSFRKTLGWNFFLFQIWARDMIRMSPETDWTIWCNWICLCCKSNRTLPNIEIEVLLEQHLEWRDIERLKWRCGKLKCSLIHEVELYITENKKYPTKWTKIESKDCETCGFVTSFNIMTGIISAKTDDWSYVKFNLEEVKQDRVNKQQEQRYSNHRDTKNKEKS